MSSLPSAPRHKKFFSILSEVPPWIDGLGGMDEAGACHALGLADGYSASEVRRAYRRLALRYHPDKQRELSDEEAKQCFRDITVAKDVLLEKLLGPVPTPPKHPKPERPRQARWCVDAQKVHGLELQRPMSARPRTARPSSAGVRGALTARSSGLPWPPETPRRPDARPESAQMSTRAQPRSYAPGSHTSDLSSLEPSPKGISKVPLKSQDLPWLQRTPNQRRPAAPALLGPVRAPVGTEPKHPERGRWAHPTVGL